jgi:two-component system sensor histidine kinase BarA
MFFRGIKRLLGESSLEAKIRILFGICLLLLITGSFLWVSRITEDLIRRNTQDKANDLRPDFILRKHLPNQEFQEENENARILFESLAKQAVATPYQADVIVLDDSIGRSFINALKATEPAEIERLNRLAEIAKAQQNEQNKQEIRNRYPARGEPETGASPLPELMAEDWVSEGSYVFYTPLIFESKGACIGCHVPAPRGEQATAEMNRIRRRLLDDATETEELKRLELDQLQMVPPMFLRITLDNQVSQGVITKNRAILITVGIVTAVFAMGAIWLIVRQWVVKPLAHLREVTEQVGAGRMDIRAELETGDELEELGRSFNKMLRHLQDAQQELQTAYEGLDKKVDEQAQLNLQLHEMNQLKSEFLANMSHELRTPLNSIIGFSEILETAKGLETKQIRYLSNIKKSGRHLLELINDILDLAKLEAGKMEINRSEFSIHHLVAELCEMVRQLAEQKQIPLLVCCPDGLPPVYQDKIKLRQILTNLLSNAIKFTPEGGRINVNIDRDPDDLLVIEVTDTGVGIAEADQQIIFEKFRQGSGALGNDALTREVSGTGLGLSIVKELCILLGGKVSLQSQLGEGSTFRVELPWVLESLPQQKSELAKSLSELAKPRLDFQRSRAWLEESLEEIPETTPPIPDDS